LRRVSRDAILSGMDVFVTRRIPEAGLDVLRAAGASLEIGEERDDATPSRERLLAGIADCRVLLCLLTERIDRELMAAAPGLRGIANMAVGFDNVDVAAATERGVPVSNTPGVLTESTADLTFALLLAVARRVSEGDRYTRDGRFRTWGPNLLLGADVGPGPDERPKVLGIVGFGRIGRAVARRASGFGMRVLAHGPRRESIDADPGVEFAPLDVLLAESDFVTLHVPLSAATRHLIGARELRAMRETAFLVNTARGPVVDEAALVEALRLGVIAGAGLVVYEREPELAAGLRELPNVVLLPHMASASLATRSRMAVIAAENAVCHLRGERAPNVVNPEVYR
jgi:glyoxylate reductase